MDSKLPWVLTFVDSKARDDKGCYEEYNSLAEQMQGKFNFGIVDRYESEHLVFTFESRYFPSTYLLTSGKSYKYNDSLTSARLERFILNADRYTEVKN